MFIALSRTCVCRMKLVGLVMGMVAMTSAAVAQDSARKQADEPSLGELMDDELSLRDLMLEDFEKEASGHEGVVRGDAEEQGEAEETEPNEPEETTDVDDELEETDEEENDESLEEPTPSKTTKSSAWDRLNRPLSEIQLNQSTSAFDGASDKAGVPTNVAADLISADVAGWITASGSVIPIHARRTAPFSHRPLYFEDPNLERCGNGLGCLQNPVSAIRFLGDAFSLPYQMTRRDPGCPVAATGVCRCGEAISCD